MSKSDKSLLIKQEIPLEEKRWLLEYSVCLSAVEATRRVYPDLESDKQTYKCSNLSKKYRPYIEKIQNETKGVVTDGVINLAPRAIEVVGEIMNNTENGAKVRLDAADKVLGYSGFVNKEQKLTVVHEYRRLLEEVGLAEVIDAETVEFTEAEKGPDDGK